jgi:heme oxygenase
VGDGSTIAGLRLATRLAHQSLERRLDVKSRFTSRSAYVEHLRGMWGFCAALEDRIGTDAFGVALPDYPDRRKLPLLTRDLTALGVSAAELESSPRCAAVPSCGDTAAAFGCVYVFEGATLGGRTLLPLVQSRLGCDAGRGAAFLASYGDAVGEMWQRFGTALDAFCFDGARRASAERAATATFAALEGWLCGQAS